MELSRMQNDIQQNDTEHKCSFSVYAVKEHLLSVIPLNAILFVVIPINNILLGVILLIAHFLMAFC